MRFLVNSEMPKLVLLHAVAAFALLYGAYWDNTLLVAIAYVALHPVVFAAGMLGAMGLQHRWLRKHLDKGTLKRSALLRAPAHLAYAGVLAAHGFVLPFAAPQEGVLFIAAVMLCLMGANRFFGIVLLMSRSDFVHTLREEMPLRA